MFFFIFLTLLVDLWAVDARIQQPLIVNSLKHQQDSVKMTPLQSYHRQQELSPSFVGDKVFRYQTSMDKIAPLVDELFLDVWSVGVGYVDVRVPSMSLDKMPPIQGTVLIEDLSALVEKERESSAITLWDTNRPLDNFHQNYHTLEEIHRFMDALAEQFPTMVKLETLGKTYKGREIRGLRIGSGNSTIFYHGGIHAREWIGVSTICYLAQNLLKKYDAHDVDVRAMLDNFNYMLVPVMNVDGYVYTHTTNRMWRKNRVPNNFFCIGTDPNRNFDHDFHGSGSSTNPCSEAYRGTKAFSSQEAQTVANFIKNNHVISYIDFHAYSQLWMTPFGSPCIKPRDDVIQKKVMSKVVDKVTAVHGTKFRSGNICETIYEASGSSIDYVYDQGVVFTYAVELRDTGRYGFILPKEQIIPTGEEIFAGIVEYSKQFLSLGL